MATRIKLLNGAAANITGTAFKNGIAKPPYTLFLFGSASGGAGEGVTIDFSPYGVDGPWMQGTGILAGAGVVETPGIIQQDLTGLRGDTIAIIQSYPKFIRARTSAAMTGTITVELQHES